MNNAGTVYVVARLPNPWPVGMDLLVVGGEVEGQRVEVFAIHGSRLRLRIAGRIDSFISQPVELNSSEGRFVIVEIAWDEQTFDFRINGQTVLEDTPGIAPLVLPLQQTVIPENSTSHRNAVSCCSKWIQNRRTKFAHTSTPRPTRRPKTLEEQAIDLRTATLRMKHLQQGVIAGHHHLLGTLAGEMRACVYWQKDAQPDRSYDPLLLRMASRADLPLPVFYVPEVPRPAVVNDAILHHIPANGPRVLRQFKTDEICDLQQSLKNTILRLGPAPGRTITGIELIAELAHTMGAAHYDPEASEFLDVLQQLQSGQGDQLLAFMCQTAGTLIALSEWILSELKKQNLIP